MADYRNNKKMGVVDTQAGGGCLPRVYRRKRVDDQWARLLVKCGDCDNSVEIYHDEESLEINGVYASIAAWRALLMPLLEPDVGGDSD